jgi:2,4-diketo-3-deoxy-L-fuconate hydrolase
VSLFPRLQSRVSAFAAGLVTVATAAYAPAFPTLDSPLSVAIAPATEALTFARTAGEMPAVLLVTSYSEGTVEAVDLSEALGRRVVDPVEVFLAEGYDRLAALATTAPTGARRRVAATSLELPLDLPDRHIAAGTNYPAHAGEAGVEDGPFLFLKDVVPSGPRAPVTGHGGLLDFEVELAWLPLGDLERGGPRPPMGLILCNDYTDRATLMRHLDTDDVTSGKGFTTGKSFPGYLPVGDLFVIPRDDRAFAAKSRLALWVNGELRQDSPVSLAIWDIDTMIEEVWRRQDLRWEHAGGQVSLLESPDRIAARTLLMTGTPSGTIFAGVTLGQKIRGVVSWLFSGFSRSLPDHVIDIYIADAQADRRFLQAGDRVTIKVDGLGVIENVVSP